MNVDAAVVWREGPPLVTDRPHTLEQLLAAAAVQADGAAVFTEEHGQAWTWPALEAASSRLAAAWAEVVTPGARVALLIGNGLAHLLAELAAWRLGAIPAPIAPLWGAERVAALLRLIEPALVIDDAAPVLASAQQRGSVPWHAAQRDDPCLILFTSGSTGAARGVVLTHDNLCSQQAAFAALWPTFGPGDRVAGYLPWHHSFGALAERLWVLARGAHFHVIPGQGRDSAAFLATLARVQPTVFCSVPKLHAVAVAAGLPPDGLRWAFTAGAALPPGVAQAYADRGIPVVEGWGLTETGPSATITPHGRPWIPGVVGEPIPGVAVGIDRQGRILVRGPGVMHGYWRDAAATARCCTRDAAGRAVLDSGDMGSWTELGLQLTGRADHQLKLTNGEKLHVAGIEAALSGAPGVRHAIVTAEPELTVLLDAPASTDDAALVAVIAAYNADEIVPWRHLMRTVRIAGPLTVERGDLTASHKVARHAVIARYRAWLAGGGDEFRRL